MPKLQAARVTQCGLDFAVVLVDPKLFMNPSELEAFSERAQALFPGVPVAIDVYKRQTVGSGDEGEAPDVAEADGAAGR